MGIFGKSKKDNLFLLFPDGREVKSEDDIKEIRNKYSFSPLTIDKLRLHKVDTEAYVEASTKIVYLGLSSEETILAFGPVKIYEYPKSHNEYIAEAILTTSKLIVYYFIGVMRPEFLVVELEDITGLTSHGGWTAAFSFKTGVHIKKDKTFEVKAPYFVLSELLGKDGHKNRRSVTLIDSLAKTLNELNLEL
jgi:hypothetical protein